MRNKQQDITPGYVCDPNCDADWHCKHGGCEGCDDCDAYECDAIEQGQYDLYECDHNY